MFLLWILLGASAAIALIISYYWIKFGAPKIVLLTGLMGVSMFLFSVVWALISMYKGEPITATLGMLAFGAPGILLILAGWKILEYKNSH
ncbi:MAG: hypothetical protein JXR31_00610 [Prolixibacteraceae bacterium]|nr:hypothetical protein [Prolixibacteraceae bacterium]MBN2772716.1 hypothetical protein [Prolixibacteraceae bacterium]